jgi:WD40 repeat protein
VTTLAVASSGRLAGGSADGTLRLWDVERLEEISMVRVRAEPPFESHFRVVHLAALTGDRVLFLSADDMPDFGKTRRTLGVWHPATGEVRELDAIFMSSPADAFTMVGNHAFVAPTGASSLRLWRLADGDVPAGPSIDAGAVTALAATPAGLVLVGNAAGKLHVWNPLDATLQAIGAHTGTVTALAVSRDGAAIASASRDGSLRVWDAARWAPLGVFHGDGALTACVWIGDDTIVAGEESGRVHVLAFERGADEK